MVAYILSLTIIIQVLFTTQPLIPFTKAFIHSKCITRDKVSWPINRQSQTQNIHAKYTPIQKRSTVLYHNSDNNANTFDLSKPIYDLYAFRMVRGDAIIQYNLRNQSEPLRINLAIISALFLLCLPALITEFSGAAIGTSTVIPTTMPLVTPDLSVTMSQTIASWIGAMGCTFIGIQQIQKRNKQLLRIEKECAAGDLKIQLPMAWIGSDRPYQTQYQSIRNVIRDKSCRILAIYGSVHTLNNMLQNELAIYNRRWIQSNTYVILIPDTTVIDKQTDQKSTILFQSRYPWLAQASNVDEWNDYFQNLKLTTSASNEKINLPNDNVYWFGLSATGRSFGSGSTKPTSYLQILGNNLSPVDILVNNNDDQVLSTDADVGNDVQVLLSCQQQFYDALTNGKLEIMTRDVFMMNNENEMDETVSDIIQQGGRLDTWDTCLQPDARPTGLMISDREVILLPDGNIAYTTCIEFPADTYLNEGISSSLLAVQKWKRIDRKIDESKTSLSGHNWKLLQHQTIPWTNDRPAGGTLLCDSRGCVALVRSAAK